MGGINSGFSVLLGARRLKISTVARETGISRATLTNLYYGRGKALSYSVLRRLCDYLECDIGDLLQKGGTGE